MFGETDEIVRSKLDAVLRHAMSPILCVGESLAERQAARAEDTVAGQLRSALENRGPEALSAIAVAYEPIWAIGTGVTASVEDAQAMCGDDPWRAPPVGRRRLGVDANPVRGFGHARQCRRAARLSGRRRLACWRRQPRRRQVRGHRVELGPELFGRRTGDRPPLDRNVLPTLRTAQRGGNLLPGRAARGGFPRCLPTFSSSST